MNDLLPLVILCSIPVCWFGAWWVMPKAILVPRWNLARCTAATTAAVLLWTQSVLSVAKCNTRRREGCSREW